MKIFRSPILIAENIVMCTKKCFKCLKNLSLDNFYRHSKMADGHLNKCKECAKSDATITRKNNLEYYQAYDRMRSNSPHRVALRDAYKKTEASKNSIFKARKKYIENNAIKYAAHIKFRNAIKSKKIIPWPICSIPECEHKPEAHHPDYSNPLGVVWLCKFHHVETHNLGRELSRKSKLVINKILSAEYENTVIEIFN